MSFDISERIETGIMAELNKNAYIIANSIPVRRYRDNTLEISPPEIVVFSRIPNTDNDRGQGVWESATEIICYTYTPDDKQMVTLRAIVEAAWDTITQTSLAQFTVSGQITFNGIVMDQGHDEEYNDKDQYVRLQLLVNVEDATITT